MEDKNFLNSSYHEQLLGNFFNERLSYIKENSYPAVLNSDPPSRFVMHLVPLKFQELYFEVRDLEKAENHFVPLGEPKERVIADFNFDGILFLSSVHMKNAYTQVFRDGRVETVACIAKESAGKGKSISPAKLQEDLVVCLSNHVSLLKKFSMPGPYYLFFRLLAVENLKIEMKDIVDCGLDAKGRNKALLLNELTFHPYKLEQDGDIQKSLLPFLNIIWNTFGFAGCP